MGLAAGAALLYTQGNIGTLVVMYSINVFITFSLTELGMSLHWIKERAKVPRWKRLLAIHGTGLVMCVSILVVTTFEKFAEGGWITLVITALVISLCFWVRSHYDEAARRLRRLDDALIGAEAQGPEDVAAEPLDPKSTTAIVCVTSFSGFGLHHVLSIHRSFPGYFKNFVFVSAAIVDSGVFKGAEEIEHLKKNTECHLQKYVTWARSHGLRADYRCALGTEAVTTTAELCRQVAEEYPRSVVFMGKLIFRQEEWYNKLLHNETALAIERRLQIQGVDAVLLPIRVLEA
jgi:hypothetical protein